MLGFLIVRRVLRTLGLGPGCVFGAAQGADDGVVEDADDRGDFWPGDGEIGRLTVPTPGLGALVGMLTVGRERAGARNDPNFSQKVLGAAAVARR